jgi:hypothetical protein
MKKPAVMLSVCLALSVTLLPAAAPAGGSFHSHRGFHSHGGFRPHAGFHGGRGFVGPGGHHGRFASVSPGHFSHKFHHHKLHHHGFHHGPFIPWFPSTVFLYGAPVVYSPPPVVSSSPIIYSSPTVYSAPPVVYSQPAPVAAAAPAVAPMPTVVEYSTGRYELRGDGVMTQHVWVWIPNPPPAPPAAAPQAPKEPPEGPAPPGSASKLYRWTDEDGTTVWTNRPDRIPERHRSTVHRPGPDGNPS